ncbi:MAG: hypothetical protein LC798_16870 [Chloroflexi bacterium]|nr:hypothetical protein [Chloroflexota bacterium]
MTPRRAWVVMGGVIVALVCLVVGLVSYILAERFGQVGDNTARIDSTEEILRIVVAITGCTTEDTPEQCRQRMGASNTAEGARRIAEVDCVTRRALAGLPAANPPMTCIEQTDPSIYPGESP